LATQADVREIALSLPGTTETTDRFGFTVDGKLMAWAWLERVEPKKPRVPNPDVIAVRVANENEKQGLLSMDPDVFFTEPHYDGYPAVLVRLERIDPALLRDVVTDAWRCRAPKRVVKEWSAGRG
jgi:hypothetical protein